MARSSLKKSSSYRFKLQRNRIIFIFYFGLIVTITITVLATFTFQNSNLFQSIAFFLIISYGIGVIFFRQYLISVNIYYHYYRMIEDGLGPIAYNRDPFSNSFFKHLNVNGYQKGAQTNQYSIHYKLFQKLPFVKRTSATLVWIAHISDHSIGLYDSILEQEFIKVKDNSIQKMKYFNELTIVFKRIQEWNREAKDSFQEIINFSLSNRAIIYLPCAVIGRSGLIYSLRPSKQFPNKYYYALLQMLYDLTEANELGI